MKVELILLLLVFISQSNGDGNCLLCAPESLRACASEVQYTLCFEGRAIPEILNCPSNTVCVNGDCVPDGSPTCTQCDVCNSLNGFACLSSNTYRDCTTNEVLTCPEGYQCYPALQPACLTLSSPATEMQCLVNENTSTTTEQSTNSSVTSSESTNPSTISSDPTSSESTTTTLSYAQDYCQRRRQLGNFASPRVTDCTE